MEKYNEKVRLFLPQKELERGVLDQVDNLSKMPFVSGVAVMADAHVGKGCSVGSVIATKGVVIPAAVGVDIGCGMIAVRTKFSAPTAPEKRRTKLSAVIWNVRKELPRIWEA